MTKLFQRSGLWWATDVLRDGAVSTHEYGPWNTQRDAENAVRRIADRDDALSSWEHGAPLELPPDYMGDPRSREIISAYRSGDLATFYALIAFTDYGRTHELLVKSELFGADNDAWSRALADGAEAYKGRG